MLTTKELIKELGILEFSVLRVGNSEHLLIRNSNGLSVAFVSGTTMHVLDTNYAEFEEIPKEKRKKLFDLLAKYTSTPHDEREEPQKYFLQFEALTDNGSGTYLNYYKSGDSLGMSTRSQSFGFQTEFTQKEIDEIKEKFGVTLSDFEQIPVEEE